MRGYSDDVEESVYNLIPRPQAVEAKAPMYRSKHQGRVAAKEVRAAATMGRPNGANAEDPMRYTRKHSKEPVLPDPAPPTQPKQKTKPAVPSRTEKPVMGLTSNKNFITTNAIDAILARPPPPPAEVNYTQRPGFGRVPGYLERNKARIMAEKTAVQEYLRAKRQAEEGEHVMALSGGEREELLGHLKAKWATLNAAFQTLPFTTDTPAKARRKEALEAQLAQAEADIKSLAHGGTVYVVLDM